MTRQVESNDIHGEEAHQNLIRFESDRINWRRAFERELWGADKTADSDGANSGGRVCAPRWLARVRSLVVGAVTLQPSEGEIHT